MKKGIILVAFLIGCATGHVFKFNNFQSAVAKTGSNCHYTYIFDDSMPNIGKEGDISYDSIWNKVLKKGLKLHSVEGKTYIFEKCLKN